MKEIIFTAILSALLTVSGSYYLMNSQLTAEQDYWLNRQTQELAEKKLNKQVELLESFNEIYLNLQLQSMKAMMGAAKFKADLHICYQAMELNYSEYKCDTKVEERLKEKQRYQQQVYKLSVLMQMFPLYFSDEVTSKVPVIHTALVKNNEKLEELSAYEVKGKYLDTEATVYFEREMETSPDFEKARTEVIDAMLREIQNAEKSLYRSAR
ncbi:hypothetical protein OA39_05109 [Vibrio campbellii]|uniref:hypothetical protein n=1 Tax=Vibrio campbellii TaxID=680 RepID=UPI0005312613|nr:hypothetical protein [Vibrio campbellii]KGR32555.1 hypothetical protein OA39_05109 [Vibrio campbellii]